MNKNNGAVLTKEKSNGMSNARTTIGLRGITKHKLDKNRAPGQRYDGFICQLIDLWESNFNKVSSI